MILKLICTAVVLIFAYWCYLGMKYNMQNLWDDEGE